MKKLTLLLLSVFGCIFPFSSIYAANSLTLGMAIGAANQQYSDYYTDIAGISGASASDASVGIRLGVPLSRNLIIDAALYDYGEANAHYIDTYGDLIGVNLSTTSINFGITGVFPIYYSPADIFGRVGLAMWDADVEFTDSSRPGTRLIDSDSGVTLYLGFGVRFSVANNMRLGFEYTFFNLNTDYNHEPGDQAVDNFSFIMDIGF